VRKTKRDNPKCYFHFLPKSASDKLSEDGLPMVGEKFSKDEPFYSILDEVTGEHKITKYKSNEPCIIDEVRVLDGESYPQNVSIKMRLNRNPIIGDKFSSRHGQKGVLSQLWPLRDMPFSESGMTPDVIINPHAFPSRMTIGMLVESLAGKSGALHGIFQDATPFQFDEKNRAVDYFGEQLVKAGYNYYGNEPLYNGITGTEFHADIYIGVVYYQRLRHMVADKYQVRATGGHHVLTHQPLKGRKIGGGIRFGEMERDSLLAHGVSFMLHDRLMICSDASKTYVCTLCGSILSTQTQKSTTTYGAQVMCRACETSQGIEVVAIPYVFLYLATELSAMNIKLTLAVSET